MTEGERIASALERIVTLLESYLLPNYHPSPYDSPDLSNVSYVDDILEREKELKNLDYRSRTGRTLGPFDELPGPLSPEGRQWDYQPSLSADKDPPEGTEKTGS